MSVKRFFAALVHRPRASESRFDEEGILISRRLRELLDVTKIEPSAGPLANISDEQDDLGIGERKKSSSLKQPDK